MYQKLDRFPLGAIRAEGFLREQLERNKNGLAGNLYKLEPEMIYWPFIEKKQVGVWTKWEHDGWAAEISGNFWAGYIQQAYTLQDEEMIGICTDWVNKVLKNQMPDGYLGTFNEPDSKIYDDYNAWGTACLLRGLIAFYEATERDDVLQAVYRC
ncbi:MAG: glycoside hydrolase family 127 protein [Clostridia bacterium]|nr:glycoside hydrolase family 127 protein [Clostridia bacterium]